MIEILHSLIFTQFDFVLLLSLCLHFPLKIVIFSVLAGRVSLCSWSPVFWHCTRGSFLSIPGLSLRSRPRMYSMWVCVKCFIRVVDTCYSVLGFFFFTWNLFCINRYGAASCFSIVILWMCHDMFNLTVIDGQFLVSSVLLCQNNVVCTFACV